jgi:lycopene cyclase domain-containing protein
VVTVDDYQYVALLLGCLLLTLPLEFVFHARVWRRPRRLAHALLPPLLLFGIWDVIATALGHWSFNDRYTTDVHLPANIPIEEMLFFVAIPICALLTLESVRYLLGDVGRAHQEGGERR